MWDEGERPDPALRKDATGTGMRGSPWAGLRGYPSTDRRREESLCRILGTVQKPAVAKKAAAGFFV